MALHLQEYIQLILLHPHMTSRKSFPVRITGFSDSSTSVTLNGLLINSDLYHADGILNLTQFSFDHHFFVVFMCLNNAQLPY